MNRVQHQKLTIDPPPKQTCAVIPTEAEVGVLNRPDWKVALESGTSLTVDPTYLLWDPTGRGIAPKEVKATGDVHITDENGVTFRFHGYPDLVLRAGSVVRTVESKALQARAA